jgi:hypothetical protein
MLWRGVTSRADHNCDNDNRPFCGRQVLGQEQGKSCRKAECNLEMEKRWLALAE